jgi:hypothetical protein
MRSLRPLSVLISVLLPVLLLSILLPAAPARAQEQTTTRELNEQQQLDVQPPQPDAQQQQQEDAPGAVSSPDTTRQTGPPPAFDAPPQDRPLRGVVWNPPAEEAQAVRALQKMKKAGVEAVRTPLIRRGALLDAADTLRLRLFQDLPAAYLSAGELDEALPDLRWELERALLAARRHPSARHFGLLSRSDTSVPRVCEALAELSARADEQGPSGVRTYYETPFIEHDRCTGAADLTLLDALNRAEPHSLLRRWQQARTDTARAPPLADSVAAVPTAVPADSVRPGIGALGTWVDPSDDGLRAPHSPASQARYFEEQLPLLLRDSMRAQAAGSVLPSTRTSADSLPTPAVVFAYRWRDAPAGGDDARTDTAQTIAPGTAQAFALEDPYGRVYGLHDASGAARPAMTVVRGFYTGGQHVFAFDAGRAPPEKRLPWLVLVGWGLVAALGAVYAGASRFRAMAQRYFSSHTFYRDAVREGRTGTLGVAGVVPLVVVGLCAGLVVTVFLLAVQETGPFVQMLRGASDETQGWVLTLLQRPWMAILAVTAFYVVCLGGWALLLSLATRGSYALDPSQTLMLVVWPRWPVLLLAVGAVVATTLPLEGMLPVSGLLVAAWVLVSVFAVGRTLYDLARMTDVSLVWAPALALLNPILLAAVMVVFAVLSFLPEATFLWRLATRS